jgi:hypothetical protein
MQETTKVFLINQLYKMKTGKTLSNLNIQNKHETHRTRNQIFKEMKLQNSDLRTAKTNLLRNNLMRQVNLLSISLIQDPSSSPI